MTLTQTLEESSRRPVWFDDLQHIKRQKMRTCIKNCLERLRFGEPQSFQRICVLPLHADLDGAPPYVALVQAMESKSLTVSEVSEHGSVPQLLVVSESDQPVLIINGEELIGAKQNRILNTSILLKERSRTIVPVSCTEQGRWAYASPKFAMSNSVLERRIRSRTSSSVSESLAQKAMHQSDQAEVWAGIQALHSKAKFSSPTSAMHDLIKAQEAQLDQCVKVFPCTEGQVGLLVLVNGRVVGVDIISRPEVYAQVHRKLLRSYVLDPLLDEPTETQNAIEAPEIGKAFIDSLEASQEQVFPSIGYGLDHRYRSTEVTGSALIHEDCLIHAAFLSLDSDKRRPTEANAGAPQK